MPDIFPSPSIAFVHVIFQTTLGGRPILVGNARRLAPYAERFFSMVDFKCEGSVEEIDTSKIIHRRGKCLELNVAANLEASVMSKRMFDEERDVQRCAREFIIRLDSAEKQDCERNAAKRWLATLGERMQDHNLSDDLFACQPICRAVLASGGDFLFTAMPESDKTLYDFMNGAKRGETQSR